MNKLFTFPVVRIKLRDLKRIKTVKFHWQTNYIKTVVKVVNIPVK